MRPNSRPMQALSMRHDAALCGSRDTCSTLRLVTDWSWMAQNSQRTTGTVARPWAPSFFDRYPAACELPEALNEASPPCLKSTDSSPLSAACKFREVDPQRIREPKKVREARVPLPPFYPRHIGPIEMSGRRQCLLR